MKTSKITTTTVPHPLTIKLIFLPYFAEKIKMVIPNRIPAKKRAPNRLILNGATQYKSSSVIQLCKDFSLVKSGNVPSLKLVPSQGSKSKLRKFFLLLTYASISFFTKPRASSWVRSHHYLFESEETLIVDEYARWSKY